jgi:predicted transport protein
MTDKIDPSFAAMERNLRETTAKTIDEWAAIARGSGRQKHKEILTYLQEEHGLTYGYANMIARKALEAVNPPPTDDPAAAVAEQYGGDKQALRPIFDAVMAHVSAFGPDIEQAPKKGYISLRRKKQFATIGPAAKSRVDLGLNLKGAEPGERLRAEAAGAMCSHKVRLESADQVDEELVGWLRQAYDRAG